MFDNLYKYIFYIEQKQIDAAIDQYTWSCLPVSNSSRDGKVKKLLSLEANLLCNLYKYIFFFEQIHIDVTIDQDPWPCLPASSSLREGKVKTLFSFEACFK